MDKKIYKSHIKNQKEVAKKKRKETKEHYKKTRTPLKERAKSVGRKAVLSIHNSCVSIVTPFIKIIYKAGEKFHAKRNDIINNKNKLEYIMASLRGTLNTTDEIRKKTIEDILEGIDKL